MNGAEFHRFAIEQIRASLGWVIRAAQVDEALSNADFRGYR
jgi:hypothetical protein